MIQKEEYETLTVTIGIEKSRLDEVMKLASNSHFEEKFWLGLCLWRGAMDIENDRRVLENAPWWIKKKYSRHIFIDVDTKARVGDYYVEEGYIEKDKIIGVEGNLPISLESTWQKYEGVVEEVIRQQEDDPWEHIVYVKQTSFGPVEHPDERTKRERNEQSGKQ